MYVYRHAGLGALPHSAQAQRTSRHMRHITRAQARPGDLIFYLSGNYAYHVSIYAGHGMDRLLRKSISFQGLDVTENTVAPFGNDPLDDVTITNTTSARVSASWFEYWDVDPYSMLGGEAVSRGLLSPTWDPTNRTLAVAQFGDDPRDTEPLSIFASALNGPAPTYDTSVSQFFGAGTRAVPAEAASDRLSATIAAPNAPGASSSANVRAPGAGVAGSRQVGDAALPLRDGAPGPGL